MPVVFIDRQATQAETDALNARCAFAGEWV